MHQPLQKSLLDTELLQGGRVVRFSDRNESRYPLLMRLSLDFGLKVLQLHPQVYSHISRKWVPGACEYVLASKQANTGCWYALTPRCTSLVALHSYAKAHEVDLLHHTLCDDDTISNETLRRFY